MKRKIRKGQIIASSLFLIIYIYIAVDSFLEKGEFCTKRLINVYSTEDLCSQNDPVPFAIFSLLIIGFCVYSILTGFGVDVWHNNKEETYWNKNQNKK